MVLEKHDLLPCNSETNQTVRENNNRVRDLCLFLIPRNTCENGSKSLSSSVSLEPCVFVFSLSMLSCSAAAAFQVFHIPLTQKTSCTRWEYCPRTCPDRNIDDSGVSKTSAAEKAVATAVTAATSETSSRSVLVPADSESAWSAVQKSPPAPSSVPSHSHPKSTQVPTPPHTIPSDVQNTWLVAWQYERSRGQKRREPGRRPRERQADGEIEGRKEYNRDQRCNSVTYMMSDVACAEK